MKLFSCQGCGQLLYFENVRCENCGRALGYLPDRTDMTALNPVPKGGWTVLAGRNSSGKSTVLQAIALCLGGPATARGLVTDFGDWISDGSPSGRVGATVVRDERGRFEGWERARVYMR